MEGAQPIGRMGNALSTERCESAPGLHATLRPDDSVDGVLECREVVSCFIVDV